MDLYLLTGFLGAGKTTLLKNMAVLFQGKKLHIIVNEFANADVDSALLADLQAHIDGIAGGSIFCACRLDQFEAALQKAVEQKPDIVLIEASGLSDPGSIRKILQLPGFEAIAYKGSVCVADAVNFEKTYTTSRLCRKQLAISSVVLINKCDLVGEAQVAALRAQIAQLNPFARIFATRFGKLEKSWLPSGEESGEDADARLVQGKDLGLVKRTVAFQDITRAQLGKFVDMVAEDSYRVKGFVRCTDGLVLVDGVGPAVHIRPAEQPGKNENALNFFSGPGLPMEKSLQKALEWYAGKASLLD